MCAGGNKVSVPSMAMEKLPLLLSLLVASATMVVELVLVVVELVVVVVVVEDEVKENDCVL